MRDAASHNATSPPMSRRTSRATEEAIEEVRRGHSVIESARKFGINRSTLFRALAQMPAGWRQLPSDVQRFVVVGAGALGREIANWIRRAQPAASVVFLDDGETMTAERAAELGVVGQIDIASLLPGDRVLVAICDPAGREAVCARLEGAVMPPYFDPSCARRGGEVGAGSVLLPNSLLSENVQLGVGVIVNTYSSIGHDCVIGDFCTLSSYVCLTSRITVGKRVFFGCGAKVLPGITIGEDAYIGAGAVVVKDIDAGAKVFGVPARAIA